MIIISQHLHSSPCTNLWCPQGLHSQDIFPLKYALTGRYSTLLRCVQGPWWRKYSGFYDFKANVTSNFFIFLQISMMVKTATTFKLTALVRSSSNLMVAALWKTMLTSCTIFLELGHFKHIFYYELYIPFIIFIDSKVRLSDISGDCLYSWHYFRLILFNIFKYFGCHQLLQAKFSFHPFLWPDQDINLFHIGASQKLFYKHLKSRLLIISFTLCHYLSHEPGSPSDENRLPIVKFTNCTFWGASYTHFGFLLIWKIR